MAKKSAFVLGSISCVENTKAVNSKAEVKDNTVYICATISGIVYRGL